MKVLRILALVAVLAVPGVSTGTGSAMAQDAATPEALAAARELVAILSKDTVHQLVTQVTAQVWPAIERGLRAKQPDIKPDVVAELRTEFERIQLEYMSGLMDDAPTIYARHFTVAELRELLAFYRTPVGAKSLRVLPQIMGESMTVVMPRLQTLQRQTMEAFTKILHQRGLEI